MFKTEIWCTKFWKIYLLLSTNLDRQENGIPDINLSLKHENTDLIVVNPFQLYFCFVFVDRAKWPGSIFWACSSMFTLLHLWRKITFYLKSSWENLHFFCITVIYYLKLNGKQYFIQMRTHEIPLLQTLKHLLCNQVNHRMYCAEKHYLRPRITKNVKKSKLMHVKQE